MSSSSESQRSSAEAIDRLRAVLNVLRSCDSEMSCTAASFFIDVAAAGKVRMVDLRHKYDLADASISRNVAYLGKTAISRSERGGRFGLGLVEVSEDDQDRRVKVVRLTSKGRALRDSLEKALA